MNRINEEIDNSVLPLLTPIFSARFRLCTEEFQGNARLERHRQPADLTAVNTKARSFPVHRERTSLPGSRGEGHFTCMRPVYPGTKAQ